MGANDLTAMGGALPSVVSATGRLAIPVAHRDKMYLGDDQTLYIAGSYATDAAVLAYIELLRRQNVQYRREVTSVEHIQGLYAENAAVVREDFTQRQGQVVGIILEAIRLRASDVHFRNEDTRSLVLVRVDGFLEPLREFSREDGREICRAMYGSMCDVAEEQYYENKSQNGRLKAEYLRQLGLTGARIGTRPTDDGNLVVLRLLMKGERKAVRELGYLPEQTEHIVRMTRNPYGINIFSGPTGAGKSTSLEVLLREMLDYLGGKTNVLTVEHPPEYKIPGAVQTPLMCDSDDPESVSRAWANAISELLRLDPDTIMIGEMRDLNSALAAFRAAMTGHGVWTTNHSNHAIQTLDRLIDLGVNPSFVTDASIVTGLINQSLVVLNCPRCARPYDAAKESLPEDLRARVEHYCNPQKVKVRGKNRGCKHCKGKGHRGRSVVAEVVTPTQKLMNVYRAEGSAAARSYWAKELGGITKCMHLIRLINEGLVDPLFAEQQVCLLDQDDIILA